MRARCIEMTHGRGKEAKRDMSKDDEVARWKEESREGKWGSGSGKKREEKAGAFLKF